MRFQKYRSKEHLCVYCFEAESKLKHKENNFCRGFLLKPKTHFFEGPKWYFLKINFQICISAFVLLCKRKLHAHFHQKILIFGPPRIFSKWKLWRACDGKLQNFEIGLLKSYLTFGYLTRSVRSKKIPHSTLLYTHLVFAKRFPFNHLYYRKMCRSNCNFLNIFDVIVGSFYEY